MGCVGCSRVCRQFFLLLWKNFILQFRRPIGTAFELILPVLAVVFILVLRTALFNTEDKCFVTFDSDPLSIPTNIPDNRFAANYYNVFYTPDTGEAATVAEILGTKLQNDTFNFTGFATEQLMVESLQAEVVTNRTGCFRNGAGIVFEQLSVDNKDISYKIRLRHEVGNGDSWNTDAASPAFELPGPRIQNSYLSEGFLHLQQLVGESIVQWRTEEEGGIYVPVDVSVRQFPYPPYQVDFFLQLVSGFLPILLVMAFLYSAGIVVKELVLEKETRIRETMLMMGLKQWVLWGSWYLKQFIFLLISVIIISILIKLVIFPNSDFILLLIFFTLFICTMISFCFFVSVWFDSSRVGLIVGFVAWFVNYIPFLFLSGRYDTLSLGAKVGSCLLSNTCLGLGVEVLSRLELRQEGLTWFNVASPISVDDNFHMAWIFCMFIIDSILYMGVAWYVNGVKPGQYGIPKPFYFPFLPSYWCEDVHCSKSKPDGIEAMTQRDPSAHEEVASGLTVGISIRNLTKIYSPTLFQRIVNLFSFSQKPGKKAVDDLNLNMYKGQITALLGHNGAGKTTTMSMLTGLYTPTHGSAEINGHSILNEMDLIRHSLGICPQHNILFDRLTVSEHLGFFLRLKGIYDRKRVRKEVTDMIADLQLTEKTGIQSQRLSGGMKRKLSVGIALIGGSEVVVLDEPTSGMDPYARRATWDLLTKHKDNRTMLLTTHFMDEADLLGDRIAIMAEGKLCCSGSSLFLKSKYGVGYHMTVVKEPSCVSSRVERLVKSFVPAAQQVTDVGAELSFILPASATGKFPDLFDKLDGQKQELNVSSFGISITTMEEVFMKVGEDTGETLENRLRRRHSLTGRTISPPPIGQTRSPPRSPPPGAENHSEVIANLDTAEPVTLPGEVTHPSVLEIAETAYGEDTDTDQDQLTNGTQQLSYKFEPNVGVTLWLQQFWAMFVKRFYNSLRFYGALISQFFFPLLFVIFGLGVAVSVPSNTSDDAPRRLLIQNSGLSPDNLTVFFAQFGGTFNLSDIKASELDATDYIDFTDEVEGIMNRIRNATPTTMADCCQYEFQLLDKFCASRTADELEKECGSNNNFGYSRCTDCLSCCYATNTSTSTLPSCSRPLTFFMGPNNNNDFCPSPPSVSLYSGTSGVLTTTSSFVAEHLLTESTRLNPAIFFRRYQAGITFTAGDPIYSVCDCQRAVPNRNNSGVCGLLGNLLAPCDPNDGMCSIYSNVNITDPRNQCPAYDSAPFSRSGSLCEDNTNCYSVDATSAEVVRVAACDAELGAGVCGTSFSNRLVSSVYPEQPSTPAVTVWYNNAPFHMSAAALNAFHNVLLREMTGVRDLNLVVINHPLPRNATSQINAALGDPTGFGVAILVVFGYSFLLSSFILFVVAEKESKAKHLQFVSGVSPTSYWLSSYAWDMINSLVPVVITVIIIAAFQVEAFSGPALGAIFLILVLTCWSSIPITYIFSFVFSNSLAAFGILMLVFFFFSLFALTIVIIVALTNPDSPVPDILHYIFLLSPTYGLGVALNDIYINQNTKNVCQRLESMTGNANVTCDDFGASYVDNPLDVKRPGVGIVCIYLLAEGFIFFILTLVIQRKLFFPEIRRLCGAGDRTSAVTSVAEPLLRGEDSDVYAERKKVMSGATDGNDAVIIKNLVKVYSAHLSGCSIRPSKTAVGGVNLSIPNGECFGLLGVNGAGKTTTFSILTGDGSQTSGTAIIAGHDIRTNIKDVQQRIGYCPQFDALLERLTGRELLTMFARLRGIPERQIKEVVNTEIRRLDLKKYADKRSSSYSGGNRRKLSTAIALVGNPPIVMLDEPTTGMDPNTRRYLWDVLTNITREGRSIILTSHSMEECEALCTRIAIMVNGTFKCLGSIQHLKNKYGSGFTLQAKVKLSTPPEGVQLQRSSSKRTSLRRTASKDSRSPTHPPRSGIVEVQMSGGTSVASNSSFNPYDTTSLHIFIKEAFTGAVLLEEHQGAVTYQLPSAGVTWSMVFRKLEGNKERLGIVDYSVSQTTLDQVFINFAKEQEESDI